MGDFSSETISHIDRHYIKTLLDNGERIDNRAFDEYRDIEIEIGPVEAKAEGSAIARLGGTSVIAGVKVLTGQPYPDTPDEGVTMVTAELAPIASPMFESGPPREDAIELARVVDRGVRESGTVDTKKLCIEEGKHVYLVFCDLYTLEYDGNLIDAASLAANAALLDTRFPELKLEDDELVETGKMMKVPLENMAIELTASKIGEHIVIDPHIREEMVQDCRLTMAIDEDDNFTALQKGGGVGPISIAKIEEAMDMGLARVKDLRKLVLEATSNKD
jgi:exosome complex component RRP42